MSFHYAFLWPAVVNYTVGDVRMADGLTNKQRAFVREYLCDFNGTQAAIRAGYSPRSAKTTASEILTYPNVKAEIDERIMSADEAAARLTDIARGDIADLMAVSSMGFTIQLIDEDEEGNRVINPKTKLIKKIKQKVTTIMPRNEQGEEREIVETELELYNAHEAQRDILKYRGKLIDRSEVTGKDGGPIQHNVLIYVPDNNRPRNGS